MAGFWGEDGAFAALCAMALLFLVGCGGPAGPQRVAVKGTIQVNGEPLKAGRITFQPTADSKGPSASATVTDGSYQFDASTGPVVGKNKVQIVSLPDPGFELDDEAAYAQAAEQKKGRPVLPREIIPPEYNTHSTQVVNVTPNGEKTFDFQINSPSTKGGR